VVSLRSFPEKGTGTAFLKMMDICIPFGHSNLTARVPDKFAVDVIKAPETSAATDPVGVVRIAIKNLLGETAWSDCAGARSVAIAINDKTRPVPHQHLLPPLLEQLDSLGIPDEAITLYVAVGTHPPMIVDEFPEILSADILRRYVVVSHDSEDADRMAYLGETSRGTPVWSNRGYVQSDFRQDRL